MRVGTSECDAVLPMHMNQTCYPQHEQARAATGDYPPEAAAGANASTSKESEHEEAGEPNEGRKKRDDSKAARRQFKWSVHEHESRLCLQCVLARQFSPASRVYGDGGYIVHLPSDNLRRAADGLDRIVREGWLDQGTRFLEIRIQIGNGNLRL